MASNGNFEFLQNPMSSAVYEQTWPLYQDLDGIIDDCNALPQCYQESVFSIPQTHSRPPRNVNGDNSVASGERRRQVSNATIYSDRSTESNEPSAKAIELTTPLSSQVSQIVEILRPVEAFVRRPAAARQQEAASAKHIPRPRNCFMLYRQAFAAHAKKIFGLCNQADISAYCGKSWSLETEPVRKRFEKLAKIEAKHHQAVHPSYKYKPAKSAVKGSTSSPPNRKASYDLSDELEDREYGWHTYTPNGISNIPQANGFHNVDGRGRFEEQFSMTPSTQPTSYYPSHATTQADSYDMRAAASASVNGTLPFRPCPVTGELWPSERLSTLDQTGDGMSACAQFYAERQHAFTQGLPVSYAPSSLQQAWSYEFV